MKCSRRTFGKRSLLALASSLVSKAIFSVQGRAAGAAREAAAFTQMPIACYLRHFSATQVDTPGGPGGIKFVSGSPLTPREAEVARSAGVSILEIHAGGVGVIPALSEVEPGVWNLDYLEQQVPLVRSYGMEPLISCCTRFVAPWQRRDPGFEPIRCAEHRLSLPLWSVWSEAAPRQIRRIIHEVAARLRRLGQESVSVIIDAHGDYGEPIFPQGMTAVAHAIREAAIDADPHLHPGFWCGDEQALRSLKRATGLDRPSPDRSDEVAWVSFLRWYHDGMTEYVRRCCEVYRAELPEARLLVFLGGGVEPPEHGQDNSGIAKAAARYGVGIRSTASGSTYPQNDWTFPERFERNWPIIKRHVTPARFYGAPVWAEPPYPPAIDPALVPARMFEAMSCGATAFHEWIDHLLQHSTVYRDLMPRARVVHPHTNVAVYFPTIDHWLSNKSYPEDFWRIASRLRRFTDYDVIDDRLILDGVLERYQLLVVPQASRMNADAAVTAVKWAAERGTLLKRPEPLSKWPGGESLAFLDGRRTVVAPDMEDSSLFACIGKALSALQLVACDERPIYATQCKEGWLILNLSDESQTVDVRGRTARIPSLMFELGG